MTPEQKALAKHRFERAETNIMKILILGTGAIGSVFGGFLAKSGCKVTLVGRPFHMEAIKKQGLKVSGIWGEHVINNLIPCVNMEEVIKSRDKNFDLALVCVKSYDTKKVVEEYLSVVREAPYNRLPTQ